MPVDEPLLEEHLEGVPRVIRFGEDGDVRTASVTRRGESTEALVVTPAGEHLFAFPFAEQHNVTNALAAIGAGVALGFEPGGTGAGGSGYRLLALSRGAAFSRRPHHPRERLLQRQPGVDARSAGQPRGG